MRRNFGKYRSRLATIAESKQPEKIEKVEGGSLKTGGAVEPEGGSVEIGGAPPGGNATGGSLKTGGSVASGGAIFNPGGAQPLSMFRVRKPTVPFEFANHQHVSSYLNKIGNDTYHQIQSGAAYIAGEVDRNVHHPIIKHRHLQSAPLGKYQRILNSSRDALVKKIKLDPDLRNALSDSIHAAHKGGLVDMRHDHFNSFGGGINLDLDEAVDAGIEIYDKAVNPAYQLNKALDSFEEMGPLDKAFSSPRHFAKASLNGYAGNFRLWSAYGKASAMAPVIGPVIAVPTLGAANAMEGYAQGLDVVNKRL